MDFIAQLKQLRSQLGDAEGLDTAVLATFDQAITQAELYQGIDPQAARTAIQQLEQRQQQDGQLQTMAGERDQLATQLADMRSQLVNSQKQFTALKGLGSAGIRPEYEELLLPQVTGSLELAENGEVEIPDGLYDGLKQKYPAMFFGEDAAGTGGAAGGGTNTTEEQPQQVTAKDGIVTGVNPDDVLSGKVNVSMG
ncbi:hypothetical protein [Leptothoe sp. PORK10 BA2]|uniref:hypothetical protein n=1 Tax=Leptothoe sp. PORK10 BA2 TaxID=3110254 RepID=UPI002B1F5DD3|nr:hypothetical protein [Leptothoe sp. PORK10 BA2]MEA5465270.1 hypothetical protein [Leptothoe sp. PORK10 BA2]